jgi:hypothetical protein
MGEYSAYCISVVNPFTKECKAMLRLSTRANQITVRFFFFWSGMMMMTLLVEHKHGKHSGTQGFIWQGQSSHAFSMA